MPPPDRKCPRHTPAGPGSFRRLLDSPSPPPGLAVLQDPHAVDDGALAGQLLEQARWLLERLFREIERAEVDRHQQPPTDILEQLQRFFGIDVIGVPCVPRAVAADGNRREIERSQALADLGERLRVARVAGEEEPLAPAGDDPR